MPIDFEPVEKILIQIRNLETYNERIIAEARREFGHRGGSDDLVFTEADLTRKLYICYNAVFFLHAGLYAARVGTQTAETLVPGAEDETRELWLQHLEDSQLEGTLRDLLPRLRKLVLRAPTLDAPYPLLPVADSVDESTPPQEER